MAGFTSEALEKKLSDLNNSQQSIQTLSLWLIHHRKHNKTVVQTWMKELRKAKQSKRLTYMYLANDVIQNSRKKGPEYAKEFSGVLKSAFETISKDCDDKTWIGLTRILNVWEERTIYEKVQVTEWRKSIGARNINEIELKNAKPQRVSSKSKRERERELQNKRKKTSHAAPAAISKPVLPPPPVPTEGVIIDPDALIKALKGLENSASSDASVRDKLAGLPPEVSDISLLDKIRDKDTAEKLSKQVDMACNMLTDYNSRLIRELEDRKNISIMLATYIKNQKDQLMLQEQKLGEYREKLKKVIHVRSELKSHLQNLPDLSLLPSVTGGLAPLPSANDLFHIDRTEHKYTSSLGSTSSASPNTASPDSISTPPTR